MHCSFISGGNTMESNWPFCTCVILFFVTSTKTTPLIRKQCIQSADGYDCSGLALQFVPDEVSDSSKTLEFSFNYLPALYNSTFQRLRSLILLDLTRCSITFMYEDIFQYQPKLESLILVGNPLVFMADSAFSGPLFLKHLNLALSMIRSLTDIPISNLYFLESLDIAGCDIRTLQGLNNFQLPQMKRLLLGMNSIDTIRTTDLLGLKQANALELSFKGNDLVDIDPRAFQSLDIGSLDLSGCLNKMPSSALLKGLEGIKVNKLYLGVYEDSSKSTITSAGLQSFCNISVVELNFQLQHFDLTEASFQCLTRLQKLDLTRAHISSFPSNLSILSNLSHLVLNENVFLDICHISAASFPMLTHLSIRGNLKFMIFMKSCLQPLSHLEVLDISHGSLIIEGSCCNNQLSGLSELQLLNLSYNLAMHWEPLPFSATPKLKHLDCSHINYSTTNISPFSNLQNLQTLNLSWSETDLSNVHLLKGLNNLRVLNLKGNVIKSGIIEQTENFNYVPLLESLVLSVCGIRSISENVFKGLTELRYVDLSENQLATLSLSAFYSLKHIQLNYARNAIRNVDVKSVEDIEEGSTIDLSYNPLVCDCINYQFINWVKENTNKMKHLQETVCDANKKINDVYLNCTSIVLAITIAVLMAIAIGVICVVSKCRARFTVYMSL